MAEGKAKMKRLYTVKHPDHVPVPVVAETAEEATVKAAQLWGVPWARVAFDCDARKECEIMPKVCVKCRKAMYEPGEEYCTRCRVIMRQDEENLQRRKARWYREQAMQEKKRKEEAG